MPRCRERGLRIENIKEYALARTVTFRCNTVILLCLTHGIPRRGKALLRLAHIEIRLPQIQIDALLSFLDIQEGDVTLRLRRVDGTARHITVENVPVHTDRGRHIRGRVAVRTKLARQPRTEGQIHRRFLPRARNIHRQLALLQRLTLCSEIKPRALCVGNTVRQRRAKRLVGNLCRQLQGLGSVNVEQIAQRREVHLVAALGTDELLPCIRQLHRGADHVNFGLCSCLVECVDIPQMGVVFVHAVALDFDFLRCLCRVPVGSNDLVFQLLTRTLRCQARRMCTDLPRTNPRLIRSAAVERQTGREADPVARLLTRIARLRCTQTIACSNRDAVLPACLTQGGIGRAFPLARDAQSCIRRKCRINRIFEAKPHRIRRQRECQHCAHEERGKSTLAPILHHNHLNLWNPFSSR